jgi:hypothetical protein
LGSVRFWTWPVLTKWCGERFDILLRVTLVRGTRLGPYEIVAPLGAGSIGQVYRARATGFAAERGPLTRLGMR